VVLLSYLIARDHAHELAFAKALGSLGVKWGKVDWFAPTVCACVV
jgi:Mn-containing catalase